MRVDYYLSFMMTLQCNLYSPASISGNASLELKALLGDIKNGIYSRRPEKFSSPIFSESIQERLVVTEMGINQKSRTRRAGQRRGWCLNLIVSESLKVGTKF